MRKLQARVQALLVAFAVVLGLPLDDAAVAQRDRASMNIVNPWRGELLDQHVGAFYVKMQVTGFPSDSLIGTGVGDVQVVLVNILQQRSYQFNHKISDISGFPREMWKLPSGKYRLVSLQYVDPTGKLRAYAPPKPQSLVVTKFCLSNFGLWVISPKGESGLNVVLQSKVNSYSEEGRKEKSSIAAVINGLNGRVQETFAGKRLIQAGDDTGGDSQLRATAKFTRQIAMFYKLDLFKHNQYAKEIAAVLTAFDANLRTCYINRVDSLAQPSGTLVVQFILSMQTGTMRKTRVSGGTLTDPKLAECLILELEQIPFPAKANMIGELTYTFDVR